MKVFLLVVSLLAGTAALSAFDRGLGDPAIIGYGKVVFDTEMQEYTRFQVDIEYRSDYFTGGTESVLYLDEFAFLYPAKK